MANHTVTIQRFEEFTDRPTFKSPLGFDTTPLSGPTLLRATIDVDDKVTDHLHYFPVEAIANRMQVYGLETEREAIEVLQREVVRSWDPINVRADAPDHERFGGMDNGIEVVWSTAADKAVDGVIAKVADRIQRAHDLANLATEAIDD